MVWQTVRRIIIWSLRVEGKDCSIHNVNKHGLKYIGEISFSYDMHFNSNALPGNISSVFHSAS